MSARAVVMAILISGVIAWPGYSSYGQQAKPPPGVAPAPPAPSPEASAQAFLKASKVFLNPRCVNCHPGGDRPLQGDDSHPHEMDIARGPEGIGKNGLLCSTCHQETNLPGAHMPPGAPGWQAPPKDMPMVFQGLTPHEICEHLKDPAQNGLRSPDEVLEHVQDAPVVLWAWRPGKGRTPVPMPHEQFVKYMKEWIDNGAACPK